MVNCRIQESRKEARCENTIGAQCTGILQKCINVDFVRYSFCQ